MIQRLNINEQDRSAFPAGGPVYLSPPPARPRVWILLVATLVAFLAITPVYSQLQQSGGPGSSVTLLAGAQVIGHIIADASSAVIGHVIVDSGTVTTVSTVTAVTGITNALPAGTNLLGYTKQRPNGCTAAGTSDVVHDTVGVATGAGTSISSVSGCVEECYVNNITNSAVTFRLADKTGTPIIWIGGNADFSIPANSNLNCASDSGLSIAGITMASGMTAIAGTASALNLHIVARE